MKKLLFINGHLNTGGVEKSLLDIIRHLDPTQYEIHLLLLEEGGDYLGELPEHIHVHLKSLKNTYGPLLKSLFHCILVRDFFGFQMRLIFLSMKIGGQKNISLAKKLLTQNQHYDCVIGFRPGICSQIAAFAVNADRKITWWHHGELNVNPDSYCEYATACDKIVVVSHSCARMLSSAFPALAHKMTVVPNMVDVFEISQKACAFNPYEDSSLIHIVTLCRLSPEKHVENTIFAAAELKKAGFQFQWHIVGSGSMEHELHMQAEASGVTDVLIFEGNQPNPYPYLKHAALFVHPSYVESQGLVVLEAMSLGIPCVVTKSLGPCEFIQDRKTALLTEQSAESLAQNILEILQNKVLYQQIRESTYCPPQFVPEAVAKQVQALIAE